LSLVNYALLKLLVSEQHLGGVSLNGGSLGLEWRERRHVNQKRKEGKKKGGCKYYLSGNFKIMSIQKLLE
jgi:hypothetical protein